MNVWDTCRKFNLMAESDVENEANTLKCFSIFSSTLREVKALLPSIRSGMSHPLCQAEKNGYNRPALVFSRAHHSAVFLLWRLTRLSY